MRYPNAPAFKQSWEKYTALRQRPKAQSIAGLVVWPPRELHLDLETKPPVGRERKTDAPIRDTNSGRPVIVERRRRPMFSQVAFYASMTIRARPALEHRRLGECLALVAIARQPWSFSKETGTRPCERPP
jgi:hypothetical protein